MKKIVSILSLILTLVLVIQLWAEESFKKHPISSTVNQEVTITTSPFDHSYSVYGSILKTYLRNGRVDYKTLKATPAQLDKYLSEIATAKYAEYETWSRSEKIAFWINAYNAYTIKAILNSYPIKPNWKTSLLYPKNSIRQIPGVWDRLKFAVLGRQISLSEIEHGILRKEFKDPRVHMAIVCASLGCPVLREEPYTGTGLDLQLDEQTRRFISDPAKFKLDKRNRVVYLSPIFKWFMEDFKPSPVDFIATYLKEDDAVWLKSGKFETKYLDYDWQLNDRDERGSK